MTTTTNKVNAFTTNQSSKMHDYRAHLRAITDGLVEMAKAAGRTHFTNNQLLRECYNLIDAELMTYDQWKEQGAYVRRGEHAYLFWGTPITRENGVRYCPVEFRFCREQVRFIQKN
jgi:hypothetical protein